MTSIFVPSDVMFSDTAASELLKRGMNDPDTDKPCGTADSGNEAMALLPKLIANIARLRAANNVLHVAVKRAQTHLLEAGDKFNIVGIGHPGNTTTGAPKESVRAMHLQQDKELCERLSFEMIKASLSMGSVIQECDEIYAYGVDPKPEECIRQ